MFSDYDFWFQKQDLSLPIAKDICLAKRRRIRHEMQMTHATFVAKLLVWLSAKIATGVSDVSDRHHRWLRARTSTQSVDCGAFSSDMATAASTSSPRKKLELSSSLLAVEACLA